MNRAGVALLLVCALPPDVFAWEIHRKSDPLEPRVREAFATVDAPERFMQFGKPVSAWLMVACFEDKGDGKPWLFATFNFSASVALGDIKARWRVDNAPIEEAFLRPKANGRLFEIFRMDGPHPVIAQLRSGAQTLKADLLLPWIGRAVPTFNVADSAKAFAQVRCKK